jgi:hypothetical protein
MSDILSESKEERSMDKPETSSLTATIAERVLAETFGGPVRLGSGCDLGGSARSSVQRFPIIEGPASAPTSVIVKQVNNDTFDPDAANDATWMLFNDWASMQFLRQVEMTTPLVPTFYGGDRQTGLFVIEDLGAGTRLDHLLLDDDAEAAEAGLLAYAEIHGRLHARTMGRQAEYLRIREALGPATSLSEYYAYDHLVPALHVIAELLELPLQPGVDDELAALKETLLDPGPFLAFVQSDAAPDNFLRDGTGWRLIDFEGGRYTHALLEGVYCRMPFPTCWCVYRLPEPIIQRAEAVYRAELARACPTAVDDTLFYRAVVEACITWALNFHAHLRPLDKMFMQDRSLVALTDRQRFLLYVNAAAGASEQFGHMRATGVSLRAIATRLAQIWPEAVEPPYYPAFS